MTMKRVLGTAVNLETSGALLEDAGAFLQCNDNPFGVTDVDGHADALFQFISETTGPTAAPTAGAVINIYERKIDSLGNISPVPDATYKYDWIGAFTPDVADAQQWLTADCPIHHYGSEGYYLEWLDGGAGVVDWDAGWSLKVIPYSWRDL